MSKGMICLCQKLLHIITQRTRTNACFNELLNIESSYGGKNDEISNLFFKIQLLKVFKTKISQLNFLRK